MNDLPLDVSLHILRFLDLPSLGALSRTSRKWNDAVFGEHNEQFWRATCEANGAKQKPFGCGTWAAACKVVERCMSGDAIEVLGTLNQWGVARVVVVLPEVDLLLVTWKAPFTDPTSLMWLHRKHDHTRFRCPTNTDLWTNHEDELTPKSFSDFQQQVVQMLKSNSTWAVPPCRRGSYGCWPSQCKGRTLSPPTCKVLSKYSAPSEFHIDARLRNGELVAAKEFASFTTPVPRQVPSSLDHGQFVAEALSSTSEYPWREWSVDQLVGRPRVFPRCGDIPGSWAPRSNGGTEVLVMRFDKAVDVIGVEVYETWHAGAVAKIEARLDATGYWQTLWTSPTKEVAGSRLLRVKTRRLNSLSNQLKLTLNTAGIRSWSEIDAVRIFGVEDEEFLVLEQETKQTAASEQKQARETGQGSSHVSKRSEDAIAQDTHQKREKACSIL